MPRAARVLAIDDDPEILKTVTEFLTFHGCEVLTAHYAGDAFMLLAVVAPDVVLVDIEMPRVDGVTDRPPTSAGHTSARAGRHGDGQRRSRSRP